MKILFNKYKEIFIYVVFGVLTTVVNWVIYAFFTNVFAVNLNIANILAWIGAVLFAFLTNKHYVFNSRDWSLKAIKTELILFVGSRLLSGVVEIGGFALLLEMGLNQTVFGIQGFVAKVVISIFVIVINYIFSKLVVFKGDRNETE